jgi:hypothetical protein
MTLSFSFAERGLAMEVTGRGRGVTRRNTGTRLAFVRGPGKLSAAANSCAKIE